MHGWCWKTGLSALVGVVSLVWLSAPLAGQGGAPPQGPPPPPPPRAAAPIDLTGYWVSVVTEDWRYRMVTPPKGDFQNIPVNAEAVKVANAWDPAADEKAGDQCKSYGAPSIMRVPGRLHITWVDDNTLQIETDAGQQKRVFHFRAAPAAQPSWQGTSTASWELPARAGGAGGQAPGPVPPPVNGTLKVVTTNLRPGYLRKNGVPYSEKTTVTEHFDVVDDMNTPWLIVESVVDDATYLQQPYVRSTQFRKEADGKGWDPSPCSSTW